MPAADRLSAEKLRADFSAGAIIGREIVVLEQTASTNDVVLQMAGDQPEGLTVFAEHQTAGRGQRANSWESPAHKGLWFSILLRPGIEPRDAPRLTTWAADVLAATFRAEYSLGATIKAPNDVYIDGRKIAGVLVEMRARPNSAHIAILGIGVNVNQSPDDFSEELRERAGSLAMARGGPVDRHLLAGTLLRELDRTYRAAFGPANNS